MEFKTSFQSTIEEFIKASIQLSRKCYPKWVPWVVFISMAVSVFSVTLMVLFLMQSFPGEMFTRISKTGHYLLAVVTAWLLSYYLFLPKLNEWLIRFARFDTDFETLVHYHVDVSGVRVDEADRITTIDWSAISSVFETKDLIAFHCRGLNYYIPKDLVGDKETQKQMIELWSNWQKAAETSPIAKNFA